jgi:hypothetical protein
MAAVIAFRLATCIEADFPADGERLANPIAAF